MLQMPRELPSRAFGQTGNYYPLQGELQLLESVSLPQDCETLQSAPLDGRGPCLQKHPDAQQSIHGEEIKDERPGSEGTGLPVGHTRRPSQKLPKEQAQKLGLCCPLMEESQTLELPTGAQPSWLS